MNKQHWKIALVLIMITAMLGGCASAKKKFIRKRESKPVRPVVFQGDENLREFSNKYYYQLHFNQWKTWHTEILTYLGGNSKKVRRSFDEAISHLQEMSRYLDEPKKAELLAALEDFEAIYRKMDSRGMKSAGTNVRTKLERSHRIIGGNFYYDKVKEFVLPDVVEL